ncbi:TetR family transcriptional regulator C-terminal domain-containing protein [Caulobacter segnis]|uniref:BetI-type transcriptional repressor C-terminal domain-containing protein n=1 Tax=Caulobacter segnis TaxID=88688 RepID=A0A2W5VBN9_9CAUL|nr:TetR family transcriptional regulator C-terminal domain-containing protein [Caulobacter segnis]PZR36692.1 MAG: hypothetical protein DI526_03060 [Caulobacter segnis]
MIASFGLAQFVLADASRRAGLPRYRASALFPSRAAFLVEVARTIAESFRQAVGPVTGAAGLRAFVDQYCRQSRAYPDAARTMHLILNECAVDSVLGEAIRTLSDRKTAMLEEFFRDAAKESGQHTEAPQADALLLLATLRGLVAHWLATRDDEALEAARGRLLDRLTLAPPLAA